MKQQKQNKYYLQGGVCPVCGKPLNLGQPQLAHRIPQTKMYLSKYGREVIHHQKNMVLVCSLKCNDAVLIGNKPEEVKALVEEING